MGATLSVTAAFFVRIQQLTPIDIGTLIPVKHDLNNNIIIIIIIIIMIMIIMIMIMIIIIIFIIKPFQEHCADFTNLQLIVSNLTYIILIKFYTIR